MVSDSIKEEDAGDVARRFEKELQVVETQQLNFSTINVVLFSYGQLRQLGDQFVTNPNGVPLLEMMLAQEALTTSVVASYGQLFTKGTGAAKLDPDKIPAEHRAAHEQLMEWRHNRYAHNGTHESMSKTVTLTVEGEEIIVRPEQTTGLYIGGADSWRALFLWINKHLLRSRTNTCPTSVEKPG